MYDVRTIVFHFLVAIQVSICCSSWRLNQLHHYTTVIAPGVLLFLFFLIFCATIMCSLLIVMLWVIAVITGELIARSNICFFNIFLFYSSTLLLKKSMRNKTMCYLYHCDFCYHVLYYSQLLASADKISL